MAERIATELEVAAAQANSAVVAERTEAALEAAAAPFKVSAAGEVRQGARVSAVVPAEEAVEAADDPAAVAGAVAVAVAVGAGKQVSSVEYRVRVKNVKKKSDEWSSVEWNSLDTRPSTPRISFDGGRNETSKQKMKRIHVASEFV